MKDGNDDCIAVAVIGITCCGSWLKAVDSEDDCDCVVVVESCEGSWLEVVDSEEDSDDDEVAAAAARLVV